MPLLDILRVTFTKRNHFMMPANAPTAGADISELRNHTTASAHAIQYLAQVSSSLSAARKPTLASVAGFALGGGFELALACDIIFCSPTAKFGLPELSVGTIPGAGGTQRLTRLVGRQRAMWLMLSGEVVSGQVMGEWGVVQCVEGDVLKETMRVAKKIASWSGPVVQLAKEAIRNGTLIHLSSWTFQVL
jgi:enoyl-CoA hydratase